MEKNDDQGGAKERHALATLGFCSIPKVLTLGQVAVLRDAVTERLGSAGKCKYGGEFLLRGLHSSPAVARVLCCDAVLDAIRMCTAPLSPALTGECDLTMNTTAGWHKDLTTDMALSDAYSNREFGVFKIAFYLQDQDEPSAAALKVRPGSHLQEALSSGPGVSLATKAGDAIVFDIRIDHAGQLLTTADRVLQKAIGLAGQALISDPEAAFTRARTTLRRTGSSRTAVFLTFGADADGTRAYERAGRGRHGPPPAALDPDVAQWLRARGVEVLCQS